MRLFEAKPYIICEVGSNWATREDAVASVGRAASVGADCVKFQAFSHDALYGWDDRSIGALGSIEKHQLPLTWLPALREKADACGIDFACTAFSPELVKAVDPFVAWHKVASSDATWPQLLEAVAKAGKPVLMSTGGKNRGDIAAAVACLKRVAPELPLALLYCVASYPARSVNMLKMSALAGTFGLPVGFSDHTTDVIWTPLSATLAGAVAIEKHFTAFPELDTPDRPHSLTPDDFKRMVDTVRGRDERAIGPTWEERDMLLRHTRRLIATCDIADGERLAYGVNYGAYRSLKDDTRGLNPFAWQSLEGASANKRIARGDGIGPGDFA